MEDIRNNKEQRLIAAQSCYFAFMLPLRLLLPTMAMRCQAVVISPSSPIYPTCFCS